MLAVVPEEKATRGASRYDAIIATFVGVCALCVSGYTAYMQRQQVRAAVWPILEFGSSNGPDIHYSLANKGVGPAIIKHVIVRVDGDPVKTWYEAMDKMQGRGQHFGAESDMSNHVLSPGEEMTVYTPHTPDNNPVAFNKSNPLFVQLNQDRGRLTVEICYCSTLGECWTVSGGGLSPSITKSVRQCPGPSEITFQQ